MDDRPQGKSDDQKSRERGLTKGYYGKKLETPELLYKERPARAVYLYNLRVRLLRLPPLHRNLQYADR